MNGRLGRQGPPSDPYRDGCGPPWALFLALAMLAVALLIGAL